MEKTFPSRAGVSNVQPTGRIQSMEMSHPAYRVSHWSCQSHSTSTACNQWVKRINTRARYPLGSSFSTAEFTIFRHPWQQTSATGVRGGVNTLDANGNMAHHLIWAWQPKNLEEPKLSTFWTCLETSQWVRLASTHHHRETLLRP